MRNRKEILTDLVHLNGSLHDLIKEISQHPWDCNEPLLIINRNNLFDILKRCVDKNISHSEIERWANAIECRDDLDFENDTLQQVIFELANPEINKKISVERLHEIINTL